MLQRAGEAIGPTVSRFGYHPGLDGIRGLAVLAIIAYHDNYHWARGAFLSVDAFFVLSGFLITTLLILEYRRADRVALGAFWGRRARRLLPALFLVLIAVALYTDHYVVPWNRASIRDDGLASLFYVANWRFILDKQSYFTLFLAASPLRHMWTLAIEEQFYLVWPLVVFACLRVGRGSTKVLAVVSGLGVVASVWAMAATYQSGDPSRAYYGTDTRAHVLLIGALTALLLLVWRPSDRVRRVIMALGGVALVATLFAWTRISDTDSRYYHGESLLFSAVIALVIVAVMNGGLAEKMLALKPLPWIGRLSYGLYLWHWPITVWLVPTRVHVGATELNLLRLGLTFVLAIVSYYLIERPIRVGWKRHPRPIAWLAPIGVGVVLLAVLASAAGAGPPPSYALGIGDPLRCGHLQPDDTQAARREYRKDGPMQLPSRVHSLRVLLVGDSTACSLWPGLREVGRENDVAVAQASVFGCGVASGEITTTRGEQIALHSERCPQLVDDALRSTLPEARPNVVVWMSIWEKSDLVVDGRTLVSGTPAGDRAMLARMDDALGAAHPRRRARRDGHGPRAGSQRRAGHQQHVQHRRRRELRAARLDRATLREAAPGQGHDRRPGPAGVPEGSAVPGVRRRRAHPARRTSPHARGRDPAEPLAPHPDRPAAPVTAAVGVDAADRTDRAALARAIRLGVLLGPAILVGVGGWIHRWTDEDAFINFRIVDQLFAGHGPVFNAGERVETYTSAAWLAVLSVGRLALELAHGSGVDVGAARPGRGGRRVRPRRVCRPGAGPATRRGDLPGRSPRGRGGPRGVGLRDVGARDGSGLVVDRRVVLRAHACGGRSGRRADRRRGTRSVGAPAGSSSSGWVRWSGPTSVS